LLTESTLKTNKMKFKLGVESEQETLDGRKVRSTFTVDGDKLIQTDRDAKEDKVICVITRELNDKGELLTTAKAGPITATRIYVKQ
jgi:fatty acid-binding protein 3